MLGKGHGGLYKAPTKEERRKWKANRRGNKIKFIDLRFERWQVVGTKQIDGHPTDLTRANLLNPIQEPPSWHF